MAVSNDRKYSKEFVYNLLEGIKGKTLGEIDRSRQFERAVRNAKITGIAGDVIEQSVFGYDRDSNQECDIEIGGMLTELKTTGVRIPKTDLVHVKGKKGAEYNAYFKAKEGISITAVTFEPDIQRDFSTSHFWEKAEHMLIIFYEYDSYESVPALEYADFKVIDYCYNVFSDNERAKLQKDWEIVRDYLDNVYSEYSDFPSRFSCLQGFTHVLRPELLLIELVPGFKLRSGGKSYQKPRYRLKKTFVDYLVRGHFNPDDKRVEMSLKDSFSSFIELDRKCHVLTEKYGGKTLLHLKDELGIGTDIKNKDFTSKCVLSMFESECRRLNDISDFTQAGIIAKTITLSPREKRTEDMKLQRVDFEEWADRDTDFEESEIYLYFCEHSFLCPIFMEDASGKPEDTVFRGFKRFAFDDDFIDGQVRRTWEDSRRLIHRDELQWEYVVNRNGEYVRNRSGSFRGAPNLPKSSEYTVFFRGGSNDSSDKERTECVNGIRMLPQFFWIKGSFMVSKLDPLPYL